MDNIISYALIFSACRINNPPNSSGGGIKEAAKKYAKAYLIPYFTLAGCNLAIQGILEIYKNCFTLWRMMKYICAILYVGSSMPNCGTLWFLPCIFLSKIGFQILSSKCPQKYQIWIILGSIMVSYGLYRFSCPLLPWRFATAFMGIAFIWIGHQGRKIVLENRHVVLQVIVVIITIVLMPFIIKNGAFVGMHRNAYGQLPIFLIGAIGGSLITIIIAKALRKSWFLTKVLGQNTIIILGFDYFSRSMVTWISEAVYTGSLHWSTAFISRLILLLGIVGIEKVAVMCVRKIRGERSFMIEKGGQ